MNKDKNYSKIELAAVILISFLSKERRKFFGRSRVKKYAKNSNQNLLDAIYKETNFEEKLGPMMAVSFEDYVEAAFLQVSEGEIQYNNEFFHNIAVPMLYFLLEEKKYFAKRKIYDFFSEYITQLLNEKELHFEGEIIDGLLDELILCHRNSFNQKSFYIQTSEYPKPNQTYLRFS